MNLITPSVDGPRQAQFVQKEPQAVASSHHAPPAAVPEELQALTPRALPIRDAAPLAATPDRPDPNHPAGQIEVDTSTIKWESSNDGDSATAEIRNQHGQL